MSLLLREPISPKVCKGCGNRDFREKEASRPVCIRKLVSAVPLISIESQADAPLLLFGGGLQSWGVWIQPCTHFKSLAHLWESCRNNLNLQASKEANARVERHRLKRSSSAQLDARECACPSPRSVEMLCVPQRAQLRGPIRHCCVAKGWRRVLLLSVVVVCGPSQNEQTSDESDATDRAMLALRTGAERPRCGSLVDRPFAFTLLPLLLLSLVLFLCGCF